jgi:mannose-6-phosphate isomerase-like protein (cupin superfamily)
MREVCNILHGRGRVKIGLREEDVELGGAIYIPVEKECYLNNTGLLPLGSA